MLNKLRKLSALPFVRNVTVLATGTAAAQAITVVSAPIITRLYGPEAFGVQGIFMSLAGIMATIAALAYPIAIVLPKSDAEARDIANLSVYIGLVMAIVATIALWLFGENLLDLMNARAIADYLYLIPVFMFFSVLSAVLSHWLIRKHEYKLAAKMGIWQAVIVNGLKAAVGLVSPSASFLVISSTFGNLLQAGLFFIGIRGRVVRFKRNENETISLFQVAKRHKDFPLLRAPQIFLNTVSQSFPVLMLASFAGPTAAAFYSIAIMALGVPSTLIGNAVAQVFYPRFNQAVQNAEEASRLLIKTTLGMAAIGLPIFAVIVAVGPFAFSFIFGEEWRTAGEYAQWLSAWLFFAFINRPSISAMPVLKVQGFLLAIEVIGIVLRALSIMYGYTIAKDETVSIALFSTTGALLNIVLITFAIITTKKYQNQRKKRI